MCNLEKQQNMQSEKRVKITELTSRASKSNFTNTLSVCIACSTIHTRAYSTIVAIKIFNLLRFKLNDKVEERQKNYLIRLVEIGVYLKKMKFLLHK